MSYLLTLWEKVVQVSETYAYFLCFPLWNPAGSVGMFEGKNDQIGPGVAVGRQRKNFWQDLRFSAEL